MSTEELNGEMISEQLSNKYLRKIERKQRRIQKKVFHEIQIQSTDTPTKNIMVCNVGLVNGFTQESILNLFIKYGDIKDIVMVPNKSYCFVIYFQVTDSAAAFVDIHGRLHWGQDNSLLYLSYTENVPRIQTNWGASLPEGLLVIENFVNEEEETELLACLQWDSEESSTENDLKHRRVKHYGYEFLYGVNNVDLTSPLAQGIPPCCSFITERLRNYDSTITFVPNQLTVNRYLPGQGIPSHIDTHSAFEDPILSLSLGAAVVMEFKKSDESHVPVFLKRRSLLLMSGTSRYKWTHGIVPRYMDVIPAQNGLTIQHRDVRTSFTFRRVLNGECYCAFPDYCDSALQRTSRLKAMDDSVAAQFETTHVHNVYEEIAPHFSDTRSKPWPNVLKFVQSFECGAIFLDIGCGNGKYLGQNKSVFEVGSDKSFGLLEICGTKSYQVNASDCLYLPYRANIADGCISIAVIHHLATQERRLRAIAEIVRVLRFGGKALIYVWAKNQAKGATKSSYLKQDRKNRKTNDSRAEQHPNKYSHVVVTNNLPLPVHTNRTQFEHQDILVPWILKTENEDRPTYLRFYHMFEEGELEELCTQLTNVKILKSFYDQGNWCIIIEKIKSIQ